MKRIIITGPTGAVGHALIEKCLSKGDIVYAVCHKHSKRTGTLPKSPHIKIVECDLQEISGLTELIPETCDIFYHLAWEGTTGSGRNDVRLQLDNIRYSLDAVRTAAALGCSTFIGAGSQAEYGRVEGALKGDTPAFPETGYGIAKLSAGQLTRLLCNQLSLRHIWVRILSVYGPYDGDASMISSTIHQLLNRETPAFTKGEQLWDYLYSADAANALYLLADSGKDGRVYPLGSGTARPLKDYIISLRDQIDPDLELGLGKISYAQNQVMHLCADITDLKQDTGFKPNYTFEEGIRATIEWHRKRNYDEKN